MEGLGDLLHERGFDLVALQAQGAHEVEIGVAQVIAFGIVGHLEKGIVGLIEHGLGQLAELAIQQSLAVRQDLLVTVCPGWILGIEGHHFLIG